MRQLLLQALQLPLSIFQSPLSPANCKSSSQNETWPSHGDWNALSRSIGGTLLRTAPVASSCYDGNPFDSPYNCSEVENQWHFGAYHAKWPESVHYSIFTNNSCIPPSADGYSKARGCSISGLPQYIVNATKEDQVGKAMAWASERGIRIVVESTGHDFMGRSTGANSLSIWTHNFNHIEHHKAWHIPGSNKNADVNRTLVGCEDITVSLGGYSQNGGHGLLSSQHGLGSDQVYQVTIVTSDGRRLVANDKQNQDLFWAVRGGGGGQFGVVTEFVLQTHPVPENVVTGGLVFYAGSDSTASEKASWAAFAEATSLMPDLMDEGITGTVDTMTGELARRYLGLTHAVPGAAVTMTLMNVNWTTGRMNDAVQRLVSRIHAVSDGNLKLSLAQSARHDYWSFTKPDFLFSRFAGTARVFTSRLLGRRELCDLPRKDLAKYLKQISAAEDDEEGTLLRFDLQGGPGPAHVPEERRGSVLPAWSKAYILAMAWGAAMNTSGDPSEELKAAAEWYEKVKGPVWRKWAPESGGYMNSGNAFSRTWKRDFYGDNYDKLMKTQRNQARNI